MKPKVTVLVALYKAGEFLQSKLKSLERQTIFNQAKIIFLNCQNHDNESELCTKFADTHQNVQHILFDEHISLYESWNVGITQSDSLYLVNYNADDQWHPQFLERCVDFLDKNAQYAIISTGVLITDIPNQLYPNWNHFGKMPAFAYPLSSAGPCPMWRRKLHEKYGLFENYRVIGDARFWERLHAGQEQFGLINDDLVLYYTSKDSLERRRDEAGISYIDLDLQQSTRL